MITNTGRWGYLHQPATHTTHATSNARIDDLYMRPYILQMYAMTQGKSNNCHGPPHVPGACSSCMHLAGLDITMTARSRAPPVLLWRKEVGHPLPASSGGGE